jgi:hypothetical protein
MISLRERLSKIFAIYFLLAFVLPLLISLPLYRIKDGTLEFWLVRAVFALSALGASYIAVSYWQSTSIEQQPS